MLLKFLSYRNISKQFCNQLVVKKQFCQNIFKGNYFRPKEKLKFIDGKTPIYTFNMKTALTGGFLVLISFNGLIVYYCGKKVYNFKERGWISIIFFSILTILFMRKFLQSSYTVSRIIQDLYLLQDGRTIQFETKFFGIIPRTFIADISTIQRPFNAQETMSITHFGFPMVIANDWYILPREVDIFQKELLPVILNANYIDTTEEFEVFDDDEIIV